MQTRMNSAFSGLRQFVVRRAKCPARRTDAGFSRRTFSQSGLLALPHAGLAATLLLFVAQNTLAQKAQETGAPTNRGSVSAGYVASIIPTPGLTSSSICGTSAVRCADDSSYMSRGSGEALNQIVRRVPFLSTASPLASSAFSPTLESAEPFLPFLGNQLVVISYVNNSTVLSDVTASYAAGFGRQDDCTLDEYLGLASAPTPDAALIATLPGAETFYHQLAGLTTTPKVFAGGCNPQFFGLPASNSFALMGGTSDGAAISAGLGSNGVYITLTDMTANTFKSTQVTSGANPGAFYVADLRGIGVFDLIETGLTDPANSSPATAVLLGKGDGTFKAPVYYDVSANSFALAAGFTVDDVNGDGIPDIVILNGTVGTYNGTVIPVTGTVTTLIGKGDGTFTIGPVSNLTWTDSLQVESGVFKTGDTKDLLVGGTVLFGSGNGSFTQGPTNNALATLNIDTAAVGGNAVGSLRNNGKLDVVVSVPGLVSIFYGNGDGTFQTGPSYAGLPDFMQVAITDIDGDGNPDIFLGTSTLGIYTQGGYDLAPPLFQILMGRGDGTFVDSVAYSQGTFGYPPNTLDTNQEIASADFNGDGKPDVLVYNSSTNGGANNLVMLPGNGTGALGTAVTSTVNNTPLFVVAAKMNGDTAYDAVVAGYGANNAGPAVSVLTNSGSGAFANEKDYVLSANPVSLAVGDFNGDGLEDVAVGESGQGVYVYFGQSNRTLGTPVQVDTSTNPVGLAAGSLTTDGRTDLIVADGTTASLHVYLGNANGTFTAEPALTTGATSLSVAALGDLNNDGKLDLIVAGFIPGTNPTPNVGNVYTFLGNGDGTFKAAVTTALTDNDLAVPTMAIGDFNHDGKLDVVVGNQSDYTELLFGNGDGTFSDSLFALAQRPATLAAADLLGNGYPEILVGQANTDGQGNSLAVLLNRGASAWTAVTTPTVTVTPSPSSITSAQSTTVSIAVSGPTGSATPTGSVALASGTYTSASTTLSSGSATITVPGSALAVGTDTLTATYTPDSSSASTYNGATGVGTITVTAVTAGSFALTNSGSVSLEAGATTGNTASVTVTPSNGFTGVVSLSCAVTIAPTGAANPATCGIPPSVSITSASAQNATLTVNTTTATAAGAYAITVTGTSGAITMTTIVNVTVAAYVTPGFTLTNGSAITISSPGTNTGNTTTITVTPAGGFTGSVTLTAALTTSPAGAVDPPTFSFGGTSPVTIINAAASGTLTVSTTPPTTGALSRPDSRRGVPWGGAGGAALAFVLFFAIPRRSRCLLGVLGVFVLLTLAELVSGCGGGNGGGTKSGSSGTTVGNYVVTVSGTSGSITQTTTVNITVN